MFNSDLLTVDDIYADGLKFHEIVSLKEEDSNNFGELSDKTFLSSGHFGKKLPLKDHPPVPIEEDSIVVDNDPADNNLEHIDNRYSFFVCF